MIIFRYLFKKAFRYCHRNFNIEKVLAAYLE